MREMLITGAARLALERGAPELMDRARALVQRLADPKLTPAEFLPATEALFDVIAEASGNLVLRLVRNGVFWLLEARGAPRPVFSRSVAPWCCAPSRRSTLHWPIAMSMHSNPQCGPSCARRNLARCCCSARLPTQRPSPNTIPRPTLRRGGLPHALPEPDEPRSPPCPPPLNFRPPPRARPIRRRRTDRRSTTGTTSPRSTSCARSTPTRSIASGSRCATSTGSAPIDREAFSQTFSLGGIPIEQTSSGRSSRRTRAGRSRGAPPPSCSRTSCTASRAR